jgi:hypothetical protein
MNPGVRPNVPFVVRFDVKDLIGINRDHRLPNVGELNDRHLLEPTPRVRDRYGYSFHMAWRDATPHHMKNLWRVATKPQENSADVKASYTAMLEPVKPTNCHEGVRPLSLTVIGNPWLNVEYVVIVKAGTFEAKEEPSGKMLIGKNIRRIGSKLAS